MPNSLHLCCVGYCFPHQLCSSLCYAHCNDAGPYEGSYYHERFLRVRPSLTISMSSKNAGQKLEYSRKRRQQEKEKRKRGGAQSTDQSSSQPGEFSPAKKQKKRASPTGAIKKSASNQEQHASNLQMTTALPKHERRQAGRIRAERIHQYNQRAGAPTCTFDVSAEPIHLSNQRAGVPT
ncbi:expressed unknown protein [Seminavis robusta]|uniref:Uncharacterized protein n=1 Tax=Seminavis robusta TaxID=568900 RepID=A0A9N8DJ95_9STRA|nr:expressed unknown protein [Seminavis robusta]|eukprot:Sro174_g076611.1  (179) ;mRNA; f:32142-32678